MENINELKNRTIDLILNAGAVLSTINLISVGIRNYPNLLEFNFFAQIIVACTIIILSAFKKKILLHTKVYFIIVCIAFVLTSTMLKLGILASSKNYIIVAPILVSFALSYRKAFIILIFFILIYLSIGLMHVYGFIVSPVDGGIYITRLSVLLVDALIIFTCSFCLLYVGNRYSNTLVKSIRVIHTKNNDIRKSEKLLIDSEERYKALVDSSPDMIMISDLEKNIVYGNANLKKITGITEKDYIKPNRQSRIHPDDQAMVNQALLSFIKSNDYQTDIIEYRLFDTNNKIQWLSGRISKVYFNHKMYIQTVSRVITKNKIQQLKLEKYQKQLAVSEKKYRSIFEGSVDAYIFIDEDFRVAAANNSYCKMAGYELEEIIGQDYKINIADRSKDWDSIFLTQAAASETNRYKIELDAIRKDGSIYPIEVNAYLMEFENSRYLWAIVRDITERKQLEKDIFNTMVSSEEKERERYAKELHDGLGPILSTIMIYLHTIQKEGNMEQKKKYNDRASSLLEEAIQCVKEISNNLSPEILKKYGLVQAIRSFIEKLKLVSKISFTINNNLNCTMKDTIQFTIYRTIIELINNSIKYAEASKIQIDFNSLDDLIQITYVDNGQGFNYENIKKKGKGLGLLNLENRIHKIGGDYHFHSEPGRGICVEIGLKIN